MIEMVMFFGMGFFLAALGVLVVAPLVHGRAVRLTTRWLEAKIPSSMAEILADKDLLRAEFCMSTRRLEMNIDQLRSKISEQLVMLGRKGDIINRLKVELSALRDQVRATEKDFPINSAVVSEAKRALAEKEAQLSKRTQELAERSRLADSQTLQLMVLNNELATLKGQLDGASHRLRAVECSRDAAVREAEQALCEKESQLSKRTQELAERSSFADSQKLEVMALKSELETLKGQLDEASLKLRAVECGRDAAVREAEQALSEKGSELAKRTQELVVLKERLENVSNELKAIKHDRDAERIELKTTTQKLMEETSKFDNFHRRAAELVQQLVVQSTEREELVRRAQQLEKRLVVQSRLLNERESELEHLRREVEIIRKAEADLRIAMIEIDGRQNSAMRSLEADKAKLQAALDRANGERTRLTYELANTKRQAEEAWAEQNDENSVLTNVAVRYGRPVSQRRMDKVAS
jgi:chromosome segregation ATPase